MVSNTNNANNYLKLVMLGEGRVGKTSLSLRFVKNNFENQTEITENASYLEKEIYLKNGDQAKLGIWDTAGQERFNALTPMYYRDALGAIIVYDITYKESFDKVNKWLEELKSQAQKHIIICIAGNKADMEQQRQITKEQADEYAKSVGAFHLSTSAKSNMGVDELYKFVAQKIVDKQAERMAKKKQKKGKLVNEKDLQAKEPNYYSRESIQIKNGKKQKNKDDKKCC